MRFLINPKYTSPTYVYKSEVGVPSGVPSLNTEGKIPVSFLPTGYGSATQLVTARLIEMTGDVSWSVNFNGSANVTAVGTLSNTGVNVGVYPKVSVDVKGRVTGGSQLVPSDIPIVDFYVREDLTGVKNESNKVFTITYTPIAKTVCIYKNGILLENNTEYTISDKTITLTVAPIPSDVLETIYFKN